MSIEGQCHFFTIYFPGFVCFVFYLDKISGERLRDHWSSGLSGVQEIYITSLPRKSVVRITDRPSAGYLGF